MAEVSQISEFGKIFIFIIIGFVMIGLTLAAARIIAPNRPNPEKLSTYECGEEPEGNAWLPFNTRFYVIALIFLLFDVEMVFIFPWTTVFANKELIAADTRWGAFSLIEMFIFVSILILGLVYVWRKGDLEWIKPVAKVATTDIPVPKSIYEQVNALQSSYKVKSFEAEVVDYKIVVSATALAEPVAKPRFKPAFKKPDNK